MLLLLPRSLRWLLLASSLVGTCAMSHGADESVLTTAAAVRRLSPAAAAEQRPVRLRGNLLLVTAPRNAVVLLVGEEGIYVELQQQVGDGTYRLGDILEVAGVTDAGDFAPIVRAREVKLLGPGVLAPPSPKTIAELNAGGYDAAWIEMVGIVRSCIPTPPDRMPVSRGGADRPETVLPSRESWLVNFAQGDDKMEVQINGPVDPARIVDARVRIRGVVFNVHNANRQFVRANVQVGDAAMIEVLSPPAADPFALPVLSLGEVLQFSPTGFSGHRVHVRGDDEELARLLRRLPTQLESKVEPYLCAFMAWHQRGRATLRERVQSELLEFHGADADAMKLFGSLLVSIRDESALRSLTGWLQERGADAIVQQAQMTQLALREGRFPATFRLLERWEPTLARYSGVERSDAEFVRRLTRAACDPSEAQATLLGSYLAGLPSTLAYSRYLLTLDVLPRAGVVTSAAQIAEQAQRRFPLSDQINTVSADIIRIARSHLDEEAKRRALTIEETQRRFADRAASLAAIRQALASGEALTARASLRELRAVRPAWMSAVERDLAFLEAIAAVLIEEPVDSRNVVRRALQVYPDEGMSLDLLRWSSELERARPLLARMLREEVAQFGHRSPAVTELLAKTDWEDAAWKNVRSADAARQAIDDALARRDPDYALRLVNLIRRSAPAWVDEAAVGLAVRELRARLQLHQKPAAATQLRELVRRGGASRAAVRGVIRDLANSGAYDDALFLATQWAESFPEDDDAAITVSNLRLKVPL